MLYAVVLFGGVVIYFVLTALAAKKSVIEAPTDDMFICEKHGPFRKNAVLTLFNGAEFETVEGDADEGKARPIHTCPLCFEEAYKQAYKPK